MKSPDNDPLKHELARYFDLEQAHKALREILADAIEHMMEFKLEQLWATLYRIDVSEKKVRKALTEYGGRALALYLADLVIERQMQKIESRKQYKNPLSE